MGKVKMPRRKLVRNNYYEQNFNDYMDMDSMSPKPEESDGSSILSNIRTRNSHKRGRAPSKNPCQNRNALMARENRQRKKEYVQRIESKLVHLQTENKDLKQVIQKQGQENQKLKFEVNHLRAVMQNSTVVTRLLKAINDSLDNNKSSKALTERLNINEDNTRDSRALACERLVNPETVCNEENSDPLYARGEELMTKLQSLVEEPEEGDEDDDDISGSSLHKSKHSDEFDDPNYTWEKNDNNLEMLSNVSTADSLNHELSSWAEQKMDSILPLPTEKSEFITEEDFNVDSMFETFNDSATETMDPTQMDSGNSSSKFDAQINENDNILPETGICIHVNRSKVSLEFCAECHARVNNLQSNERVES